MWLGAAMIIGSGSTSFEMLRYVGDRFRLMPMPAWSANPIDPISIRDVLVLPRLPPPTPTRVPRRVRHPRSRRTTSYGDLLRAYAGSPGSGGRRANRRVDTSVVSWMTAAVLPVPGGLAADLVESLDHPMMASDARLRDIVPDPPGGLLGIDDSISRALSSDRRRPVTALADPHHLADTDPRWAGGDTVRIRQLARAVTPSIARPALGLLGLVPGPSRARCAPGWTRVIRLVPNRTRVSQRSSRVRFVDDARAVGSTANRSAKRSGEAASVVVAVVLVIGGALLGYSLTRRPGDASFYWLTLALAAVWALGALASGPLHLGWRSGVAIGAPVIDGTVVGLALGGVFLLGGLVAREIPAVREFIVRVLEFANHGPLVLVAFITVINGVAEELFFRGALYTALGKAYPAVMSTVIYVIATSATTGKPDAGFRRGACRCGVRLGTPRHRRGAGTDAHPLLLGAGHGARTAAVFRRLARLEQVVEDRNRIAVGQLLNHPLIQRDTLLHDARSSRGPLTMRTVRNLISPVVSSFRRRAWSRDVRSR